MNEPELNEYMVRIREARQGSMMNMAAIATEVLVRIAAAQEALVELANADISDAIQERAEQVAHELEADKSKRSFIGRQT